jgi:hypothetical protein
MMRQNKKVVKKMHLFIEAVPHLNIISKKAVFKLALRFNISPQHLQKRIDKANERRGTIEI